MSKEIAQTVGGKKIAWLLAILAALAVFATVLQQQHNAKADVLAANWNVTQVPPAGTNIVEGTLPTYTVSTVTTTTVGTAGALVISGTLGTATSGLTITGFTPVAGPVPVCVAGPALPAPQNTFVCTYTGPIPVGTALSLIIATKVNPAGSLGVLPTPTFSVKDAGSAQPAQTIVPAPAIGGLNLQGSTVTALKTGPATVPAAGAPVSYSIAFTAAPVGGNVTLGGVISFQDALPAGLGSPTLSPAVAGCSIALQVLTCTNLAVPAGTTVTVTVIGITAANPTVASLTNPLTSFTDANGPSGTFGPTGPAAALVSGLCPGLYHLDPFGNILVGALVPDTNNTSGGGTGFCYPAFMRDVPNNVITANHTVCFVDTAPVTVTGVGPVLSLGPILAVDPPQTGILAQHFRITTINGTSNVQGQVLTPKTPPVFAGALVFPITAIAADWQQVTNGPVIIPAGGNRLPLSCVTWYSTGAGEQNITVVDAFGNVTADWADGPTIGGVDANASGATTPPWIGPFTPLVKEWNTLTYTEIYNIAIVGPSAPTTPVVVTNTVITATLTGLNAGTGFLSGTSAQYGEYVWGTHTNATGTFNGLMIGALVTFTRIGTCGAINIQGTNTPAGGPIVLGIGNFDTFTNATIGGVPIVPTALAAAPTTAPYLNRVPATGVLTLGNITTAVTVTSVGVPIPFTINAGQGLAAGDPNHCLSATGSQTGVRITVTYPNNTGSVTPVLPDETLMIQWQLTQPQKQVFLAWAGQRVMLEHDWRFFPGESSATGLITSTPTGTCIFPSPIGATTPSTNFLIQYVKGSGPGNFVAGLGAFLNGSDAATVNVSTTNSQFLDGTLLAGAAGQGVATNPVGIADAPTRPQDACISRVIYESEDQGEVDIEAFQGLNPLGQTPTIDNTKVAFVIYYMKLESVTLGLVTQVSKPTHNSTDSDYAPGNPWDASKDAKDATADWNVSKDLLVRGTVKGWFTTTNPSGRTAGTDSNGGGLPAGRWVMPDDWPLLFGGPADPADGSDARGVAESFRPQYDYMIAPNSTTRSFNSPDGLGADSTTTTVAVAMSDTATTVTVTSAAVIFDGTCIRIDNEWMRVISKTNPPTFTPSVLTVDRSLLAQLSCIPAGFFPVAPYAHAVGARVSQPTGIPFEGPFSLLDINSLFIFGAGGAALSNLVPGAIRDTIWGDTDIDKYDAPMPPAAIIVDDRGSGFIKQINKANVYYIGTPNKASVAQGGDQVFTNPYYISNIPESPYLPASVAGGSYYWDSWGIDGPGGASGQGVYPFWTAIPSYVAFAPGRNPAGITDATVTAAGVAELNAIRTLYGCLYPQFGVGEACTIGRTLVLYSDNHGEFMVTANGDFMLTYDACAANALGGGKHCKPGDKVGASTITAVADYPDFKGKHYPLASNQAKVNWTWGGYKSVSVEKGETDQYKYIVFHALDRDGFCTNSASLLGLDYSPVLLHPVLTAIDGGSAATTLAGVYIATGTTNSPTTQTITVVDSTGFAVGQLIRIENELRMITAINGNSIDVYGPLYQTTATVHPAGAAVFAGLITPIGQLTAPVINGGDLLLTVTTTAGLTVGSIIRIDNELLTVTGVTPTTLTVSRGANGSTAGAHLSGAYVLVTGSLGPVELVDFLIDSGEGIILNTSGGGFIDTGKQFASSVPTYSTLAVASTFKKFPLSSLAASGAKDECQAYIRVSNSLLSVVNVLTVAHDDEGNIGFDNVIDLTNTTTYTLAFRWSLITWAGADGISPTDALKATGKNTGGTAIYDKVTAVYGWNQTSQTWLGFFPSGVGVPGANDLTSLVLGNAYWVAITGPDSVTWTVVSSVN